MRKRIKHSAGESSLQRSAVLPRIFLTYCLLLLVIFVMLFPMYRSIIQSEQQHNLSEHHTMTETGYGQMVSRLNNSILQLSVLGYDSTFERLAVLPNLLTNQQYWYLREALQSLSYFSYQNDMVREALVFFRDNDIILTTRRAFTPEQPFYNNKFFSVDGLDADGFSDMCDTCLTYSKITFLETRKVFLGEQGAADTIICYIPISIKGQSSGLCGAFLFLNAEKVAQQVDLAQRGCVYALADGQGHIFHTSGCTNDEAYALISQMKDGRAERNGITYDAISIHASALQLTCFCFTDIRLFIDQTRQVMHFVILTVMIALAAGIAISVWLTHVQYAPIKRLRQVVSFNREDFNSGYNEFDDFIDAYMEIRQSNENYSLIIQEYGRRLTENEFEGVLNGAIDEVKIQALTDRIPVLRGQFRMIGITFGADAEGNIPNGEEIPAVLKNLARRFWDDTPYIHKTPRGVTLMIIPNDPQDEDEMINCVEWLGYHAGEHMGTKTMVVVSYMCSVPEDIHDAYQRLILMQNAHIWSADKNITQLFFDHGQKYAHNTLLLNEFKEAQLAAFIESGNSEGAQALIKGLAQQCTPGSEDYAQLFYSIRALVLEKYHKLNMDGNFEIPAYQSSNAQTDNLQAMTCCCMNLCDIYMAQSKKNNLPFDEQMTMYIDMHYDDPELYGKTIANQFGLSEKYLYTYFKKHTGIGLSEYLSMKRLKEAAALLADTDLSIQDIAIKVGFNSHNTFYKSFKRYYGCNPSEYRTDNTHPSPERAAPPPDTCDAACAPFQAPSGRRR